MQVPDLSQASYRFMLSLTSLKTEEFLELLPHFHLLWQHYHRHYDLQGRRRRIAKYSGHASVSLRGSAWELFFVLIYLKQDSLQCYHALAFQMSQGKVSQWPKVLLPLLEQALDRVQKTPARAPGHLYLSLRLLSGQALLLDATERPVPRPVDPERQKHEYSGKKGCHTNKNLLVVSQQNRVLYLSATVAGSMRDKALADETELEFSEGQGLLLDLGFLGYQPEGAHTCPPFKKPPKGRLSDCQKRYNQLLASLRVSVGHVMAGVKRMRIVKEKIRMQNDLLRDSVMLIACGLHNLRVDMRNLS